MLYKIEKQRNICLRINLLTNTTENILPNVWSHSKNRTEVEYKKRLQFGNEFYSNY